MSKLYGLDDIMKDNMRDCVTGVSIPDHINKKCELSEIVPILEMMDGKGTVSKDVHSDMNRLIEAISKFKGEVKNIFESKEINEYFGEKLDLLYEMFTWDYNVSVYNINDFVAYSYTKNKTM